MALSSFTDSVVCSGHRFLLRYSFPNAVPKPCRLEIAPVCSMTANILASSSTFHFSGVAMTSSGSVYAPAPCSYASGFVQEGSELSSEDLGLLLEVEGVLADVHRIGNRQAFNVAFQKLGLDCAHWTEPIHLDLTRKAGGDEERMLVLFFNRIGWPTSLPTNEKESFMKSVMREKKKALDDFVQAGNLPLRPGVEQFIDDALNKSIPVAMLAAYSKYGDNMARFVIEKLGSSRISNIKIVGKQEVEGSLYGQLVLGKGVSSSLEEKLAKETQKAISIEKLRIANEVASILKISVDITTGTPESMDQIVAALRAAAECIGIPVQNCVLVAGGQTGVLGAVRIGMPCVVIRSSLTSRAEFQSANAVMDGFGGADLTVSKLLQKRWR